MAGQTIPISTANQMITDYINYMENLGVDMKNQTQSVAFTKHDLMDWLSGAMTHADELRIFMGVYPQGDPAEGRSTVILWPYQNGDPANDGAFSPALMDPFNEGSGHP